MILRDMIEEVNSLIDHNPDITTHTNHIVRTINRHYEFVCSQAPYRFLQGRNTLTVLADVAGTAANTIGVTNGTDIVVATGATVFDRAYEGMAFTGPDGVEVPITGVNDAGVLLYLETAYAGATVSSASWSITMDKVFFPKDMVDFLGITTRSEFANSGPDRRLTYMDPRKEEEFLFDWTTSGDITYILDREGSQVDVQDLVIVLSLASGTGLTADQVFEYCATLEYLHMESPPTKPVQITPTGGNRNVTVTFANPPGAHDIRYRKNIYRRSVTNNTPWERITSVEPRASHLSVTASFEDTGIKGDPSLPLYYQTPRPVMKLHNKPSTDTDIEIRYMKRPPRLTGDTDAPLMPPQYHMILVYLTLGDLYTQYGMGNLARLYESRAEEKIVDMRRRYLDRADRYYRKQAFAGVGINDGYRYGTPTKS